MSFSEIPIRKNGLDIDASWFNIIRQKLLALDNAGVEYYQTNLLLGSNDLNGLTAIAANASTFAGIKVFYQAMRRNEIDESEVIQAGSFDLIYRANNDLGWTILGDDVNIMGDAGVRFDFAQGGTQNTVLTVRAIIDELLESAQEDEKSSITIRRELWPVQLSQEP